MAHPVGFEGMNAVMIAPEDMDCRDLPSFRDGKHIISCWQLSPEEIKAVAETGCIWLSIFGKNTPPVLVSGTPLVEIDSVPSKPEKTP